MRPVRFLKLPFCAALVVMLTACAEREVTPLGQETYMVTAQSRLNGNNGAAAAGVLKADAWCKERGKRLQLTGAETSDGVFAVWPSKSVVMFKCVS